MPPTAPAAAHRRLRLPRALFALGLAASLGACSSFQRPELPGETTWVTRTLRIDGPLTLDWSPLEKLLSVRPDQFLLPGQPFNPYRKAEDARRIAAFWQNAGYFDVRDVEADVRFDEAAHAVDITWRLTEGPAYRVRAIDLRGAPPALEPQLRRRIAFAPGDRVDLHAYRWHRHAMADDLRRAGWLRAEVYSRAFVDRAAQQVDWVYYVDPGPPSVVGEVRVSGNVAVPTDVILARLGLRPGEPIDFDRVEALELALLDTGAFSAARLHADYGTEFVTNAVPADSWIPPDTGGLIPPSRVAPDGSLLPRPGLAAAVDFDVAVVEAPATAGRVALGLSADTERLDPQASLRLQLRNALGPLNHLVLEGDVGYALRWRGELDEPLGLYGSALARFVRAGFLSRLLDLRLTARFDERLHAGYHWREAALGLGLRSTLAHGLFLDLEPRLRLDAPVGLGTLSPATLAALDLAPPATTTNAELALSLTWDARDNGHEPMRGHLVALRAAWAPGGPLGDTPWLSLEADLRLILPFSPDLALALRASGGLALALDDDAGVPIGARLFGGGAYGMRGFGHDRFAVYAERCHGATCASVPVGAASLVESALELRWLPYRQQFGLVLFADLGGAGVRTNPFDDGVSGDVGAGLRARPWSLALAIDFAYRVTDLAAYDALDRFFVFARIGEAF